MTRPSNFVDETILFAGPLNAALDAKADLVGGVLPDAQAPAGLTAGVAAAEAAATAAGTTAAAAQAAATAAETSVAGLTGGLAAKADLVAGKVPLAELPYTAGSNVIISGAGVISASGGGGAGSTPVAASFAQRNFIAGETALTGGGPGTPLVLSSVSDQNGTHVLWAGHPLLNPDGSAVAAGGDWACVCEIVCDPLAWGGMGPGIYVADATGRSISFEIDVYDGDSRLWLGMAEFSDAHTYAGSPLNSGLPVVGGPSYWIRWQSKGGVLSAAIASGPGNAAAWDVVYSSNAPWLVPTEIGPGQNAQAVGGTYPNIARQLIVNSMTFVEAV